MQVMTNVTPEEYKQAIKLNRNKSYWWKLLVANWYMSLMLIVIVWAEIAAALNGKLRAETLPIVLVPILFLWFSWYRTQKAIENVAQQISDLKASASLDADGIRATTSSGATSFVPWNDFSDWKEGTDVFTITAGKTFRVFSKRGLGASGEDEVRSLLRSNVS